MTPPALGRDALVLCAGTIPRATFRQRAAAACVAGFAGLSLRTRDCAEALADLGAPGARALLQDHGLRVAELEAIVGWPAPLDAPAVREPLRLAAALGARSVSVVAGPGRLAEPEAVAAAFAALADRAAEDGLCVHIEFWPGSALDFETAAAVVATAGRRNGGLLVDTWHLARTPGGWERCAALPGGCVLAVQLGDSPAVIEPEPDYLRAAMRDRLLPGEGALDLAAFVRGLDAAGADAPLGIEVWNAELAAAPAEAVARRAAAALRRVVRAARADG